MSPDAASSPPNTATIKVSRTDVRRLVGLALVDERTAIKALVLGPEKVRGVVGERCAEAMTALGLKPLCEQEQGK
jgi:hypothetical protein